MAYVMVSANIALDNVQDQIFWDCIVNEWALLVYPGF